MHFFFSVSLWLQNSHSKLVYVTCSNESSLPMALETLCKLTFNVLNSANLRLFPEIYWQFIWILYLLFKFFIITWMAVHIWHFLSACLDVLTSPTLDETAVIFWRVWDYLFCFLFQASLRCIYHAIFIAVKMINNSE